MKKILIIFFLVGIFIGATDSSPTNVIKINKDNGKDVIAINDATVVNTHLVIPVAYDLAIRGPSTQFVTFELSNCQKDVCVLNIRQEMMSNDRTKYDFSESTYTYNWNMMTMESTMLFICPHDVAMPSKACTSDLLVTADLLPEDSLLIASECNPMPLKISMMNDVSGIKNDGMISGIYQSTSTV